MKLNLSRSLILSTGTLLVTSLALHATDMDDGTNSPAAESAFEAENITNSFEDYYRADELSLDGFGTASIGKYTIDHLSGSRVRHNTQLGAGAGINYFVTRNIGVGAEAYSENVTGAFIDSAAADLILRLPLGQSGFAPYAFGGGGRHFDTVRTWFGQAGAGMEYRFTQHVGVFIDARGVLPEETKFYGVARLGMRFAF